MKLGIVKEIQAGERRVASTPETIRKIIKLGFEVIVQSGAGTEAGFSDETFTNAGAALRPEAAGVWGEADLIIKVRPPENNPALGTHEAGLLREGGTLIGFIYPAQHKEMLDLLAARKATVLAMDLIPRITRAQKMDALS